MEKWARPRLALPACKGGRGRALTRPRRYHSIPPPDELTADAPSPTPIAFPRIRSAIVLCDHAPMMRPALWESDIQAALKRNRWAFLADIADSSYTESDRDCRRENGVKNVRHDASPLLSCHDTLLFCKYSILSLTPMMGFGAPSQFNRPPYAHECPPFWQQIWER